MAQLEVGGRILNGRFQLVRLIGEGGMGVVWEAIEVASGQPCALKFVRGEAWTPMLTKRLLREAKAAQAVRHPNIVTISEVAIADDGEPVVVMELLSGESLADCLDRRPVLPIPLAAGILERVIAGVRAAHAAGVVHRDLKPENIFLVDDSDGTFDIRILDFGIAKRMGGQHDLSQTENLTVTGAVMGTPYYMSPEQAFGEKSIDAQTDVWATGVIAFECLTGTRPVQGDNIGQLMKALFSGDFAKLSQTAPDLPKDILEAVDRALTVDRTARAPSVDELGEVMHRHASGRLTTSLLDRPTSARFSFGDVRIGEAPDVLGSTQLASVRPPAATTPSKGAAAKTDASGASTEEAPRRSRAPWLAAAVAAVVLGLGVPGVWLATRGRPATGHIIATSSGATTTATPLLDKPSEPLASSSAAPLSLLPLSPSHEPSAVAPVAPSSAPRPAPSASASASAKRPGARAGAGASSTRPASTAPAAASAIKLQGGVAGDTPF